MGGDGKTGWKERRGMKGGGKGKMEVTGKLKRDGGGEDESGSCNVRDVGF